MGGILSFRRFDTLHTRWHPTPIHTNVNELYNLFIKVCISNSLQPITSTTATPPLQVESTGWVNPNVEGRGCLLHCGGFYVAHDDDDDDDDDDRVFDGDDSCHFLVVLK